MTVNFSKKDLIKQSLHLIDNWLDYQVYSKEIPGVAVGIFIEDEIIFQKEYGYADLENKQKLTKDHLFRIASHSKLFTASAIMKLYHQGKLSIDDKISKYLPWFTSTNDENLEQMRIYHLLTHSSGITRDGETAHWINYKFPEIQEIIDQVHQGISFYNTSETLKYSNFGYTLLGLIIESVSKQSYVDYIQKEIFNPLEMTNSIVDINEKNEKKHAIGYGIKYPREEREKLEHVPARVMHAATGLSSNVEDMIKFYRAHIFGNDILFPDYIKREMQRIQYKSKTFDRGLGFSIVSFNDTKIVGHSGGYPGFITQSGLNQDEKVIIIVLTNAIDGPASTLFSGLNKLIDKICKEKQSFTLKEDEELLNMKEITGFYYCVWGTSLFSQIGSKLVGITPGADNPVDTLEIYEHKAGLVFKSPKEPPFGSPGQDIEFIDGPDGQKIFIDSHKGENKRFEFSY